MGKVNWLFVSFHLFRLFTSHASNRHRHFLLHWPSSFILFIPFPSISYCSRPPPLAPLQNLRTLRPSTLSSTCLVSFVRTPFSPIHRTTTQPVRFLQIMSLMTVNLPQRHLKKKNLKKLQFLLNWKMLRTRFLQKRRSSSCEYHMTHCRIPCKHSKTSSTPLIRYSINESY